MQPPSGGTGELRGPATAAATDATERRSCRQSRRSDGHNIGGDKFERLTDWQLVVDTEQLKRHLLPHLWWDRSDRVAGSGDGGQPSQP